MAVAAAQQPAIGVRVVLGGKQKATVRYVGRIDGQQGDWVGIEYDEPGRGKHDGSHGGRRYFACAHDQTAGSFVRLGKFLEAADCGRSLLAAARERYRSSSGGSGSNAGGSASAGSGGSGDAGDEQQLYVQTTSKRRVVVELVLTPVGASARRPSTAGAAAAVLVQQGISSVGDALELQAVLPGLTELDLSDNLFASWSFVAELAAVLPSLLALNLSGNRLAMPSLAAAEAVAAAAAAPPGDPTATSAPITADLAWSGARLASLQTLVLNGCGVSWQQAVAAARQLPNLREFRLCQNGLTSLQLPPAANGGTSSTGGGSSSSAAGAASGSQNPLSPQARAPPEGSGAGSSTSRTGGSSSNSAGLLAAAFGRLELLDLEDNALSSWGDVALLSQLPALRSLLLSGNQLTEVQFAGGFTSLQALLLGANRLGSWAAVSQLDCFPALEEARLSDNPVTAAAPSTARYQCIARISGLNTLNASAVSAAERWDAEVNYLRLVTDELAGAGADVAARAALLADHPRFGALTQKYGELTPAAPKVATGSSLASSMAQLTICHGAKVLQKKLPVSLTVGKLKLMLERLLRVKAAQQALLLVPPPDGDAQAEDITDDDSRELRYYDICDGCRLEVSASDPASRAAALAAAKHVATEAHAQRMEQQEKTIQQFRAVEQQLMT